MKPMRGGVVMMGLAFWAAAAIVQAAATRPEGDGAKVDAGAASVQKAVPEISLSDLKQAIMKKTVTLLDCNGSKAYAGGHIPGAIDFEAAKADLAKMLPKDKTALVVAYCGGPQCAAYKAGAEAAMKLGYTNVKHYAGGISEWKEIGEACEAAELCPKCGQIKGSPVCCKAGAVKCEMCGLVKGSPGCCARDKAK